MREKKTLVRRPGRRTDGTEVELVREVIAAGLCPTASAHERVKALLAMGLRVEELSLALDVAENTIRNWAEGTADPRRTADRVLDDLRTVVAALDEAGVQGPRAANWLRSRNRAWLSSERPLDLLRSDPLLVLAAAEEPALVEHEPKQTVHSLASAQARRDAKGNTANEDEQPQAKVVAK